MLMTTSLIHGTTESVNTNLHLIIPILILLKPGIL